MKAFLNSISAAPYAKSESERIKYVIFRATVALFASIFLLGFISLTLKSTFFHSSLATALQAVWAISVGMYTAMWFVIGTRFYTWAFLIWTIGFSISSYLLITVGNNEESVYRTLIFITVAILIMSSFLRRAPLYAAAAYLYLAVFIAVVNANLGSPGFLFGLLFVCAFSIGAIELILRIRKAEEKILAQERARALHTSRLSTLGETTAFLVHEVSSPLTILASHLELIEKRENLEYHTAKMKNALDRAIDFITSVKRMVRANQPGEYEVVQLSEILKMVSDLIESSLKRRNIWLEFDFTEDIELKCRPAEIAQVLINLINNSAEAATQQSERWIRVACKKEGNCLNFEVSDPGSGISANVAGRIMDPFFTTKDTGSGIGLAIAQQVASHHDGRIDILKLKNPTTVRMRIALSPKFVDTGV